MLSLCLITKRIVFGFFMMSLFFTDWDRILTPSPYYVVSSCRLTSQPVDTHSLISAEPGLYHGSAVPSYIAIWYRPQGPGTLAQASHEGADPGPILTEARTWILQNHSSSPRPGALQARRVGPTGPKLV